MKHYSNYNSDFEALTAVYPLLAESDVVLVRKQGFYVYYEGMVSRPGVYADSTAGQRFFVNGNPVEDDTLSDSVARAYARVCKGKDKPAAGKYPLAALHLTIKPYRLDEFTKDGKHKVRFYDPHNVGNFCMDAVIEALSAFSV
jgi:DNA mismatch repair ATPase MutL